MSSKLQPVIYGPQGLELQWLNCIVNNHGLFCGCDHPFDHLQNILQRKGHQLCLTESGEKEDAGTQTDKDDDIGISPGDLELLFAEDGEDDTG